MAEQAVLGGIFQYGGDAFVDCDDLVDVNHFSDEVHQGLYKCFQDFFAANPQHRIDIPTILSIANKLGLSVLHMEDSQRYLRSVQNYRTELPTVRREAEKLFKLAIAKELHWRTRDAARQLEKVTGDEGLTEIVGLAENPIFEYTSSLNEEEQGIIHIAKGGREWLEDLINNPRENIGIPTPYAKYNEAIGGGYRRGTISLVAARKKVGKAQPLDAPVFTPRGPILMGDIAVGDVVSTPSGGMARVLSLHPQGSVPIYRVVFGDGDSTECTLDHLWEVRHSRKSHYEVKSLGDIVNAGLMCGEKLRKWRVRLPECCFYEFRTVPMDPYLLGVLLGNGGMTTTALKLSSADSETLDAVRQLLPAGHHLTRVSEYDYNIVGVDNRNKVARLLRHLGLWGKGSHDKFVPEVYLHNSREVRLAILQGLLDTDGSADKRGQTIEYSSASKHLAYGVKELVQSLGGLAKVTYRQTTCQTGTFWSYRVLVKHNDLTQFFRLSRKQARMRKRRKPPLHRTIKQVEYIGRKPAQCIKLDTRDGLYLTDHHIVTHNTIWCDNVCLHIASVLGMPVLNIDTEMSQHQHLARILAHRTGIPSLLIERGKIDKRQADECRRAMDWLESIPYSYQCVTGKSFEEQVASMRRWAIRDVGEDANGVRKDCFIAYDYMQLTDPREFSKKDNFQEYQLLGFQMVGLLGMAARCDLPVMSMAQLNREGGIAASDRMTWKTSSYATLARKEEGDNKSRMLVVEDSRHGSGTEPGDYINFEFDGATARLTEGKTRFELEKDRRNAKPTIQCDDDDTECVFDCDIQQRIPQ